MRNMKSAELREKFLTFFEKNGHAVVPSSSLLPTDPSVLFTTAGMQQFKPYYLGEPSPWGRNTASCQKCIRTSDIEEVGDERHLTFFEMLGNFSFGGYWKKEAITFAYNFVAGELGLKIDYVTVYKGSENVPFDEESFKIWQELGVKDIRKEGSDNFWGPTGSGGPCGPTTEIYVNGIEIWNVVFNEFFCDGSREQLDKGEAKLTPLDIPGIDTGMGLERLAAVVQNVPTVFDTDLFAELLKLIPEKADLDDRKKRIIVDHVRAIAFLISDGVIPSNKYQGYILRRLIRRVVAYEFLNHVHLIQTERNFCDVLAKKVAEDNNLKWNEIILVLSTERNRFLETLEKGISEYTKLEKIDVVSAFYLYQTFGLPFDVLKELDPNKTKDLKHEDFEKELKKHQELSKTASAGMFKGGLADHDQKTIRLHTAHHLLLAALQELFGKEVKQRGSNINQERLRIDFSLDHKMTEEEKKQVQDMVNEKINQDLVVVKREMPKEEAEKLGAEMEFGVKYGNTVSVYFIEDKQGNVFSKEFCGGPHVENTAGLGRFKILKEEAVSAGVRRIKAILE